ncbi:TPA: alpha-glucosidase [bacterium]|nr:alpha-glucosidase [bacterium]
MKESKWFKEAIGYQIYPRSFKDSNNDGIGDIRGIISKLDYLSYLGVNLIWIGPIYKSPMDDNGYDVSDFYQIAEEYGTLNDVEELITEAHKRDIKIIFDLILNHTSDEHPWFIESRKSKDNPYRDYYIWQEGKNGGPPTNWASFFGGSCWNFDPQTNMYYMKIFSNKMPDLNWENKKFRDEMKKMIKWWLDKGIDGFRMDAIAHLAKDTSFSDGKVDKGYIYSGEWSKFSNRDELFIYLKELKDDVFSKYDCVTIGEVGGGASTKDALRYSSYKNGSIDMVFTFDHCWENGAFMSEHKKDEEIKTNVISLKKQFAKWQKLYNKSWNPLYWLNHDHPRVISQYGDPINYFNESAKMLAQTLHFMWGTPFIYQGEEIGMTNVDFNRIDQFKDTYIFDYAKDAKKRGLSEDQIINYLRRTSRVNARTPMQWDGSIYAGFSNTKPWIDVIGNYSYINVKNQIYDQNSILNHYRKLIEFRKDSEYKKTIIYGKFKLINMKHPQIFAYLRELDKKIIVLSNFTNEKTQFTIRNYQFRKLIISSYLDSPVINRKSYTLRPFESLVIEVE